VLGGEGGGAAAGSLSARSFARVSRMPACLHLPACLPAFCFCFPRPTFASSPLPTIVRVIQRPVLHLPPRRIRRAAPAGSVPCMVSWWSLLLLLLLGVTVVSRHHRQSGILTTGGGYSLRIGCWCRCWIETRPDPGIQFKSREEEGKKEERNVEERTETKRAGLVVLLMIHGVVANMRNHI